MAYIVLIIFLAIGCVSTFALVIREEGRKDGSL